MAAEITVKNELKFELGFADGDTRTVTLKNPRNDLTLPDLQTVLNSYGSVFVGDKAGAPYTGFSNARKVATTTRKYSL